MKDAANPFANSREHAGVVNDPEGNAEVWRDGVWLTKQIDYFSEPVWPGVIELDIVDGDHPNNDVRCHRGRSKTAKVILPSPQ